MDTNGSCNFQLHNNRGSRPGFWSKIILRFCCTHTVFAKMSSFSYAKTSVSLEMRYPNPLVFKPHFSLPKNWHLANPPCRCRPIQGSKSRMYERGMERTGFTLQPVDNGDGQGMTSHNWAYDDQQKMWAKAWKLDLRHSWVGGKKNLKQRLKVYP